MNVVELYNSRVRDLISQKYREISKERQELITRQNELSKKLLDQMIPYHEYIAMKDELVSVKAEIRYLDVEINTWDQAREICFQAADEFGHVNISTLDNQ